jgi:DNA-binding transcriptional ArsR family regulator
MTTSGRAADLRLVVGVIGPADLVLVVELGRAREFPTLTVRALPYQNEAQAVDLVRTHRTEVDAWLFTGVIPYTLAREAGVLDRPATHISYSGASLYRALLELLGRGHDARHISIDTLDKDQVIEAFRDASLSADRVHVAEYRRPDDASRFATFHRAAARGGATVAITCVRSVYDEISGDVEAVRLSPAIASIRSALQTIVLASLGQVSADAQVVLGFIDLSDPDPELSDEVSGLSGSVFTIQSSQYLIVTTRGVLEEATGGFQHLPPLTALARRHLWAHIGLGVGRSAAEADALARHALARCRSVGPFSAVISMGSGSDVVLRVPGGDEGVTHDAPVPVMVAARRSGVSRGTLTRLKSMLDTHADAGVTASDIASALSIEPRSARRTLKRLEQAGVARPIGRVVAGTTGRPPTVYRIRLE